ncbi:Phosphatidic acid phosphatase type 2/haloperoxidase [Penicillium cf. griseofulvum]|uniref:Phosphatidic acid phosphatase type 2/haloperoxidase n=1 Tax=Penicillium cf. griseofulvum TaxID=2972120 RepID=A0A9W9M391_9EURO|nr:Phosphatidic acid phosphatase type 2/haloperoxidase [Penicillium cf. griseofulvum]KAJ5429364.1 Phosphatidic acid phosphatase type 2/haloperoxidase [Penicillium cf. griseofulvum]
MPIPIKETVTRLATISKLLLLSYIVDWIFIIGTALIGYGFYEQPQNHHPFSLTDQTISYPYTKETVSTKTLLLVCLFAPAILILLISWLVVPAKATTSTSDSTSPTPKPPAAQYIRRKFWEWNVGWMGLALALASTWTATQGLKVLIGKPRPDLLARCDPDITRIAEFTVGGLGDSVRGAATLVSWEICRDRSDALRIDGFSSFPSGHASFSFAGLGYLTLWLCSKFSVAFPYLPRYPVEDQTHRDDDTSVRKRGAAPPVYLMLIAFVPTATASFIAASRWFNYRHHGFDILFGAALGIFFAYIGFNMYHLPIRRGAGWAWGARSRGRAFMRGVGVPSSLGTDGWAGERGLDVESAGREIMVRGQGQGHVKPESGEGMAVRLEG